MIVRPATAGDIEGMVALLQRHMNAKWPPERWRRLFTYAWATERPDYGRVIENEGEIIGCLAAVYSERVINGRRERFCNPCAWYIRKDVRRQAIGLGLAMMRDLTADLTRHYVINTSSPNTTHLLRRAGFIVLDEQKYVWTRQTALAAPPTGSAIDIVNDRATVAALVGEAERRLIEDHGSLPAIPRLVRHAEGATLFMLAETTKGEGERWLDVLYASDPACLSRHGAAIAARLLAGPNEFFSADSRFCKAPPPGAAARPIEVPHFAKSAGLAPHHLDHLYSEIQLLDLKLR